MKESLKLLNQEQDFLFTWIPKVGVYAQKVNTTFHQERIASQN
jgi:hypothetical protein